MQMENEAGDGLRICILEDPNDADTQEEGINFFF